MASNVIDATQATVDEAMETNSEASSTDTIVDTGSSEGPSTSTVVATEDLTDTLYLRFARVSRPFKLPDYPEVAFEVKKYFKDPETSVTWYKRGAEKIYKIELGTKVPKKGHTIPFKVENHTFSVDLYHWERKSVKTYSSFTRGPRSDDTILLTFWAAGQIDLKEVPNSHFDKLIQVDLQLELDRPTQLQKIPFTDIYNGNRFCVIKTPENLARIPDSIPVVNQATGLQKQIYINYLGKVKHCARCNKEHPGRCPELVAFYAAKEEKEKMTKNGEIKTAIYSDSTLRSTNTLGLRSEVVCMSGGGLGQVTQAAKDDPDVVDKKNVIIVAGANDIKNRQYETNEQFAQNINACLEKLVELAGENEEKIYTIVNTHPKIPLESEDNDTHRVRDRFLYKAINKVVDEYEKENLQSLSFFFDADETGHPTTDGTKMLLQAINETSGIDPPLIWNEEWITSENIYKHVNSIYRYGCNHCEKFGRDISHERYRNGNVCDECSDLVTANASTVSYPLLDISMEEICKESSVSKKRDHGNDSDEETNLQTTKLVILDSNTNDVHDENQNADA